MHNPMFKLSGYLMKRRKMMEMWILILVTLSVLDGGQGIACIQYRISTESLNTVGHVIASQQNGYFVYSQNELVMEDQIDAFTYRLKNLKVKSVNVTDISFTVTQGNNIKANATLSKLELDGDLLLKRTQDEELIFNGTTEALLKNNTLISEGDVGYGGMSDLMAMSKCTFTSQAVTLSPAELNFIPNETVNTFVTNLVCSVYKLQFPLGFQNTTLDIDMNLFKIKGAFYPARLAIENETLLLTHRYGHAPDLLPESDFNLPPFPPVQRSASPFEIWVNNDVFSDLLESFFKQMLTEHGGKVSISDILPDILPLKKEMRSEELFVIPAIPETFPNSTADFLITDGSVSFEITPEKCLLNVSVIVELQIALNCNRSKVYTPLKLSLNVFFPVQFVYDQERISLRYALFGGNITVLETTIGRIKDPFWSHWIFILPQWRGKEIVDKANEHIKGLSFSHMIPTGTYLNNVTATAMQGYLVIHGNLNDKPSTSNQSGEFPNYSDDYLRDLWFPLYDDTPEDEKGIPVQDCTIKFTSGASSTTWFSQLVIWAFANIVLMVIGLKDLK